MVIKGYNMKIKILTFTILFILVISTITNVWGEDLERYINVRVRNPRQENEYINISGREDLKIKIGTPIQSDLILDTQSKNLNVKIDSYYSDDIYYNEYNSKSTEGPYHIVLRKTYQSFSEAFDALSEIENEVNINGFVYYDGDSYYTIFGRYTTDDRAENIARSNFNEYNFNIENHKSNSIIVLDEYDNVIFSYKNDYNIFFTSGADSTLFFDGVEYHGDAAFYIIDEYKLISINIVPLEEYLKGVVPSEIPASWHIESLKAQAVAARTYAVANTLDSTPYGYHVVDNQNSQVYNGLDREYSSTNKAVEETKNELIYYNNNLITAFYHSTSGGKTADSGNVWSYTLPYLKSKEDNFSNISPHTDWNISYTTEELIDIFKGEFNTEEIYDMDVIEVSNDERVIETSIKTDKGEINLIKEEVRAVLGYSKLKSTWFSIEKNNQLSIVTKEDNYKTNLAENSKLSYKDNKIENTVIGYNENEMILNANENFGAKSSPDTFTLIGKGWGHGIGMSQYGARQMAEEGFTYKEILEYYYTGVTVK